MVGERTKKEELKKAVMECIKTEAYNVIKKLKEEMGEYIISKVLKRCNENLQRARAIPSKYMMPNQPLPNKPLPYVSSIVEPFSKFLSKPEITYLVSPFDRDHWKLSLFTEICSNFQKISKEILETSSVTHLFSHNMLKKKSPSVEGSGPSHYDKIFSQLHLDFAHLGNLLKDLDVDILSFSPYQDLVLSLKKN